MKEQTIKHAAIPGNRWQNAAPIAALIFLSPVLTELLVGTLRVSDLWLLFPEMGVYGLGALIIREVARRKGRGWGTMLLLGVAFGIAEECVILQTSLTPQFFPPAFEKNFGWAYGVQWIYLLAMVWFESVYAIVLPIYLAELLFPRQRHTLWLSQSGLAAAGVLFTLSAVGVWQLWKHTGLRQYAPSAYQVPPLYIAAALLVIAVLVSVTLAIKPPAQTARRSTRRTPAAWLVGFLAFGFGLAWFLMIGLAYNPAALFGGLSPAVPLATGLGWIWLGLWIVQRISTAEGWQDRQRLALIFGASAASMVGGILTLIKAVPVDIIGKFVLDLVAVALFIWLGGKLRRRVAVKDEIACQPPAK